MTIAVEYSALAPIIIMLGAGVVAMLIEAFAPRAARRSLQMLLTFGSIVVALGYVIINFTASIDETVNNGGQQFGVRELLAGGSAAADGPGWFLQGLILLVAFVGALLFAEKGVDPQGDAFAARSSTLPGSEDERQFTAQGWYQTEIWPLFMFAVGGMLLFAVSNDLLTMFIALEVMSLPLYLMAGMARRRRLLSQEAALKYFVLGAFSSAFFLFGAALVYAIAGSVTFNTIADSTANSLQDPMLFSGIALIAVGMLFKVGAVPFHQWTPDVYQGSPTALTAFMGAATKVAAFGALFRIFYVAFGSMRWEWRPMMWTIAILTMLVGSILAVTQSDIKRMLAYSSVAHTGFILLALIAATPAGLSSSLIYLAAYAFTTLGVFAIVSIVRDSSGEANHLSQWAGLGKKSPLVASIFALFLLALAGIPLTSGFTAKFAVFTAAVDGGATPLVIIAVISSAIAAFFYARVIVLMFFSPETSNTADVVIPTFFTSAAISISAAVTILLGVLPQPVIDLAIKAGIFVR